MRFETKLKIYGDVFSMRQALRGSLSPSSRDRRIFPWQGDLQGHWLKKQLKIPSFTAMSHAPFPLESSIFQTVSSNERLNPVKQGGETQSWLASRVLLDFETLVWKPPYSIFVSSDSLCFFFLTKEVPPLSLFKLEGIVKMENKPVGWVGVGPH